MRKALALLAIGVAGASSSVAASTARTAPLAPVKSCGAGYVHASLPWGEKCLRAGEFCKIGNSAYIRFGFVCPSSGHLRRR
ncbi:MAG TPA: hypothetical protein VMT74_13395 [Gaiellaceae bacterium]|nr:hypothetical protein [Gaiellaceae bacterium]